jgi:hypothetical protein
MAQKGAAELIFCDRREQKAAFPSCRHGGAEDLRSNRRFCFFFLRRLFIKTLNAAVHPSVALLTTRHTRTKETMHIHTTRMMAHRCVKKYIQIQCRYM